MHAIFGGFHLFPLPMKKALQIIKNIKNTNIQNIAPSHCTGEVAIDLMKQELGSRWIQNGAGMQFHFEE